MDKISIFVIRVLAVGVLGVTAAPVPRVNKVNRTLSCCGEVYIPITEGCDNTFEIEETIHARVEKGGVVDQEPFQLQMKVMECVDFTHTSTCDVGATQTSQEITHYTMTPCSKDSAPGAAAVPQGSLFSFLMAMAVVAMFC